MAKRIGKADFDASVKEAKGLVLVEFYSDSCIPCKQLSPILGDIEDDYEGKVAVYKVNVNFDAELAEAYQVMSSPTLLLFKNGEVADKKKGLVKKDELAGWLDTYL
ncbi:MAG: thioredoxin fold domain-containing protein [Lachnospiraceae bacterium]|nr:thioredoxin fold domain-containing protein [Lachnospiraceae bacterium]